MADDKSVNSYEAMAKAAENEEFERQRKIRQIRNRRIMIGTSISVFFLSINIFFLVKGFELDAKIERILSDA